MGGTTPTIDFTKYETPAATPQIDFSEYETPKPEETGVVASLKRNTIGAVQGLYHAFSAPATDQEKQELLQKVRDENAKGGKVPETLATNPSRTTLAYHRLIDAPADVLAKKGSDERAAAHDLLSRGELWKGANTYLSGLTDTALSAVPLAGPAINATAERAERGDVSGAATDVATAVAAENVPAAARWAKSQIPNAERAGAALGQVKSVAGSVPVDMTGPGKLALELYTQSQRGATLPKVVRDFVNRATKPGSDPITYAEAKDFQSNISRLSANERMNLNPNTQRLLLMLNSSLKGSLEGAADVVGKGEQFTNAMKEYHRAMKISGATDEVIDAVKNNLVRALVTGAGITGGGYVLKKALEP